MGQIKNFHFSFNHGRGRGTKAVQGAEKLRISNFEWIMLKGNGLRGAEGGNERRNRTKVAKNERRIFSHTEDTEGTLNLTADLR